VASTGAHGANRLASNSLLEAVVFGARVAADIASLPAASLPKLSGEAQTAETANSAVTEQAEHTLRLAMTSGAGVIRDEDSLRGVLATIGELGRTHGGDRRIANMLIAAKLIAAAAYQRKESRGAHFRKDFPTPDESQAKRSHLTLAQAEEIVLAAGETPRAASRHGAAFGPAALHA
jgi:L-aspartate oxidase